MARIAEIYSFISDYDRGISALCNAEGESNSRDHYWRYYIKNKVNTFSSTLEELLPDWTPPTALLISEEEVAEREKIMEGTKALRKEVGD